MIIYLYIKILKEKQCQLCHLHSRESEWLNHVAIGTPEGGLTHLAECVRKEWYDVEEGSHINLRLNALVIGLLLSLQLVLNEVAEHPQWTRRLCPLPKFK